MGEAQELPVKRCWACLGSRAPASLVSPCSGVLRGARREQLQGGGVALQGAELLEQAAAQSASGNAAMLVGRFFFGFGQRLWFVVCLS